MKKISIIILNYNGFWDTVKCLDSLKFLKNGSYLLNTLLVDNGSSKKELAALKKYLKKNRRKLSFADINLLENDQNLGFAKGNNIGIKKALEEGADYILILNNDIVLEMNFLTNLLKINADISSPVVKFREFKGKSQLLYDMGGFVNWTTGRTWHKNIREKNFNSYKKSDPIDVDYVAGCCLLAKRKVFETIGFLDEKYFIYFEDVDFCITAKKRGLRVIVDPQSVIYHKLGGSMDRWSNRAIYRNLLGNFIFISKHLGIRRISAYFYLFILTAKILSDRVRDKLTKSKSQREIKKKWRGARPSIKI